MRTLMLLMLAGCLGEPTWTEHPCGRGDPVEFTCDDTDTVVLDDASTDRCEDLGVAAGDLCETVDDRCVLLQGYHCAADPDGPHNSEAFLHCRNKAWSENDLICPQSSRSVKRDIVYVGDAERRALAAQVLDVKLARYDYVDAGSPGRKLGYILEDSPDATFSGDGRVDLYAYLSALVATTQEQQRRIDRLEAQVRALQEGGPGAPAAPTKAP